MDGVHLILAVEGPIPLISMSIVIEEVSGEPVVQDANATSVVRSPALLTPKTNTVYSVSESNGA